MYMLGISLWIDEAWLAESIVNRTFSEMLTPPLVNMQTAPVLYLVVVKALTIVFGTSEAVLRVFSFISLIGMLIVQGVLLRKVFQVRMVFTLFSVAVSSTFLFFMQYSNEVKPYMGDAAFVLVVFLAYYAYREGFLFRGVRNAVLLGLILSVCMLFSTPATFAAASVIIVEFIVKCIRKDKTAILLIILSGVIFIIAFLLNYFLWLSSMATYDPMVEFWDNRKFDFMIFSGDALRHNISIISDLLEPVWHAIWIVLPFAIAGFLISLAKKNVYTVTIGVFFLLLLIASAIGKYPIVSRLWMFLFVILFIYIFVFIDALRISINDGQAAKIVQKIIPLFLAFLILVPNMAFPAFGRGEDWTLTAGNQANPLIAYVKDNIREGETLYSYYSANTILRFKNGYDSHRIGNVDNDNIVFGTTEINDDIEIISELGGNGVYILFYHSYYPLIHDWQIAYIVDNLMERGYVSQIMDVYFTFLYWYTDDITQVKAAANLNIYNLDTTDGKISGVFRIENTGGTILSPVRPGTPDNPTGIRGSDDKGGLAVVLRNDKTDIILKTIVSPVPPGGIAEVQIERGNLEPGEYLIDLVSIGQYSFSELGFEPIPVTVEK